MNDKSRGQHDAHEDERIRYVRAKKAEAFERIMRRRENALLPPRCNRYAGDEGVDDTGFSDGII